MADAQVKEQAAGRYDFAAIEPKWQRYWDEHKTFKVANPGEAGFDASKPKCYVLDFFPYPSGAGLHVGHPLGYCATDIYCRYKRMKGYQVLHPMGYDAFGLPAEQYAIEHNVHPAETTKKNIATYHRQLKMLGFSFDWDRELATCDPSYYRWTQWIFTLLFESWFDELAEGKDEKGNDYRGKARPISELVSALESGTIGVDEGCRLVRDPANQPHRKWADLSGDEQSVVIDDQRLAYTDEVPVNWCPALGTVLSNEEVTAEGKSERGNHPVYRRPLRQWMMRITKYADRLLADLDGVDWPEPIKLMQRNWIGRSEGAEVDFPIASGGPNAPTVGDVDGWFAGRATSGYPGDAGDGVIRIYTTRPDTLFGATYMVLAPEHALVDRITTDEQRHDVDKYVNAAKHRSELERMAETKEKSGVFTGAYAINPVNGERIPVWVADYVLMGYGTGAIMAVPAGDTRDFEFAKKFKLPIRAVVDPPNDWLLAAAEGADELEPGPARLDMARVRATYRQKPEIFPEAYTGYAVAIQAGEFDGMASVEFKPKITAWLAERGLGRMAVNYKIRDWVFSRQKYWGEPFPIEYTDDGRAVSMAKEDLPLELPPIDDFKPTVSDDPQAMPAPPLSRAKEWVTVECDGQTYRRDTNTMPQWAGSCWYYLRFCDPDNESNAWGREAEKYWMPIDLYVGGAEHAVLHLLYARFWHKALFDLGQVSTIEPFGKLINQGMIQGFAYRDDRGVNVTADMVDETEEGHYVHKETGEALMRYIAKISKSLKNIVTPDDIIAEYGTDAFRMYEMFMGPIEASKPWNTRDVPGVFRLLSRIWRLVVDQETNKLSEQLSDEPADEETQRLLHKTIKKVGEDIESFKFNTAIGQIFDFVNHLTPLENRSREVVRTLVRVMSPFAPHMGEELWQRLGGEPSVTQQPWPEYDAGLARDEQIEVPVQINGKVRSRVLVDVDADETAMEAAARADEKVVAALEGRTVRKVIAVKGRLVNMVCS